MTKHTGKVKNMEVEKIEKTPIDVDGKLEQRTKLLATLKENVAKFEKDLETRKYLIEGQEHIASLLLDFIDNKAEWKFSEALGIVETSKQISEILEAIRKGKTKEVMVSHLALEALYYFMSKSAGSGLDSAKQFVFLLKPISDALGRAKQDKDKKDQMYKDIASVESAIDTGAVSDIEEKLIEEIASENTNEK